MIVNNETKFKEVRFDIYCKTCKHQAIKDYDDPCNECLENFMNINSHKPVNWKAKENSKPEKSV